MSPISSAKSNCLRAAGAKAISEMLKVNKTLTLLDLSDNEIGAEKGYYGDIIKTTPEGPAALADGLKANQSVQQLDVSANGLGADGGKALAASISENSTIILVSDEQYSFVTFFLTVCPLPFLAFCGLSW